MHYEFCVPVILDTAYNKGLEVQSLLRTHVQDEDGMCMCESCCTTLSALEPVGGIWFIRRLLSHIIIVIVMKFHCR